MPKPNLAPIYERLNGVPTYHPMTAETFADWAMEAGDLIAVSRDGNAYTSPVSTSRMIWKGSQQISIDSTGSKEREAISRISRRKYGRGGGSLTNNNYIYHEITDESGLLKTTIQATESLIRLEVSNSYAGLTSTIEQTASSLRSLIISSKSSTIYPQYTDPDDGTRLVNEGDMWIKTNSIRTWEDFFNGNVSWGEGSQWDWKEMRGALVYTRKNGKWQLVSDEQTVATLTDIDQTNERIALVARSVDTIDGKMRANEAKFEVKANQIESTVSDRTNALDSRITQTASSIRSEVNAVEQGLQSSIEQTSSSIRSEVKSSIDGLSSSITQTASQIRSEVRNSVNGLSSSITQTASSIRSEVSNSYRGLSSSITQTASSIRSEVSNSYKGLSSFIEQTASQIRSEVSNSYKGLSSSITQTASSIRAEVSNSVSGLNSYIQTQAGRIDLVVEGSGANAKIKPAQIVAAINNGASSIVISASHIDLDGYVKASDITSDYIKTKMQAVTGNLTVGGNIYAGLNGSSYFQGTSLKLVGSSSSQGASILTLSYSTMIEAIKSASVSGNTLTLTRMDGTTLDFSKATSLSGVWSGSTYTVTAKQNNVKVNEISASVGLRFNSASGQYYVAAYRTDSSGNPIDIISYTYKLGVSGSTVQIQDSSGTQYAHTPTYTIPSHPDKGAYWYCTVINESSGTRTVRLAKTFQAGASLPFSNGSSYHLYT